jgi:large subunit ribosomal protein L37Ae
MRKHHRCPQCGFPQVKRESVGIWKCRKCGHTYTGGAYIPITKLGIVAKRVAKSTPVTEAIKTEAPAAETEETD